MLLQIESNQDFIQWIPVVTNDYKGNLKKNTAYYNLVRKRSGFQFSEETNHKYESNEILSTLHEITWNVAEKIDVILDRWGTPKT